jgi:hypothetical protein
MIRRWILGAILLTLATPASADSCDALLAAHVKELHTPHRYDNKITRDDRVELELTEISVNGRRFVKTSSPVRLEGWQVHPWDPDREAEAYRKASARNEPDCHADGTDAIDGEPTDIITSMNANGFTTHTWISRATGLPVKEESEPHESQTSHSTYSYKDITAPDTN